MFPLVSVVMPTFGRPDHLLRAIASVAAQDYPDIELLIVDDNDPSSADRSRTEIAVGELSNAGNAAVRYIRRPANGGGSRARNDGISAATGHFITFLDDDDEYLPQKISKQVRHLLAGELDISLCGMEAIRNGKPVPYKRSFPTGTTLREFVVDGCTFTPMIMVKRSLITQAGGFPVTPRFQDHLLMLRLLELSPAVSILREKLYRFHMHGGARITLSPKSVEAVLIKHEMENRHVELLTPEERRLLRLRQTEEHLLVHAKHGKGSLTELKKALSNADSLSEAALYLKATLKGNVAKSKLAQAARRIFKI